MNQGSVDIGILTVIPAELWAAVRTLGLEGRHKAHNGTVYRTGTVRSNFGRAYSVALTCIGDAGNPGAAAAATELIGTVNPRCVLLMGIAAGLRGKVKIGQVVVGDRIVNYERGAYEVDECGNPVFQPRPDTERLSHGIFQDLIHYEADGDRILALFERANGIVPTATPGRETEFAAHVARSIAVSLSTIASGEKLLKNPSALLRLREIHGKIEAAEMEATGFADACKRQGVPWLVFRGISDFGDQFKDDRFHGFASRAAAAVMADFIEHGLDLNIPDEPERGTASVSRERPAPETIRPRGPIGAPKLPPHFLPRSQDLEVLKDRLLADRTEPVAVTGVGRVGMQGMGGIGKTVLASALVHDRAVQQAFSDGIYWITIGQEPDVMALQNQLVRQVTGSKSATVEASELKELLREAFNGRQSLIVLDDVWHADHAYAFCDACGSAQVLVTTRNKDVLVRIGAVEHRVDVLSPREAVALLADWAGKTPADHLPLEAAEIAKECGYLPLALAAIGAMIRLSPTAWPDALTRLRRADLAEIARASPDYPYPDLLRALAVSIDAMAVADRERYLDLAVFPEDQPIPESVLSVLWKLDELATRDCMRRFVARSLASSPDARDGEALLLHDLQRDVVRKRREAELPQVHLRLLREWDMLPRLADAYAWRWLSYHLVKAGRIDDLRRLLIDFRYLQAKLDATDPNALIADFDYFDDAALGSIQAAIRLSTHALGDDTHQLAGQLTGRLLTHRAEDIIALLESAALPRTWPWLRPLTGILTSPGGTLVQTFEGHLGPVTSVVITPDGLRAVSGSDDGTLRLWDLASGRSIVTFEGHTDSICSIALTPNGHHVISASNDGTLRLWDLERGHSILMLVNEGSGVYSIAVTPNGRRVVAATSDGITMWDLQSGHISTVNVGVHLYGESFIAVTPDGSRAIVTETLNNSIWMCDLENGRTIRTFQSSGSVTHIAITPDGRQIVTGLNRGVEVWDIETGRHVFRFETHSARINYLAITSDSCRVLSASDDGTLEMWNLQSGLSIFILDGHTAAIRSVALSPDGRQALSASNDQTLRLWDLQRGRSTLEHHASSINFVALTPSGHALSASDDKTLKMWNLESGRSILTLQGHAAYVTSVAITPDGCRALSTSYDKTLRLWDLENGRSILTLRGHSESVHAVAITADGRRALSAASDQTLRLWDLQSGHTIRTFVGHESSIEGIAIVPDGSRAISASHDGTLRLWDLESGHVLAILRGHHEPVRSVALAPDGRHAISASDDGTLRVWDIEAGGTIRSLEGHTDSVTSVAITPDGRRAVSTSYDCTLRVWDLVNGLIISTFKGHTDAVNCVTMLQTGRHVLTASQDRTLRMWNIENGCSTVISFEGHAGAVNAVAITPDEHRAVSASNDRTLRIWNAGSDCSFLTLEGHAGPVTSVAIAADGRRAISASDDRTLRLWDLQSGRSRTIFEGHSANPAWSVAITPDGCRALSGWHDGALRMVDLESGRIIFDVAAHAAPVSSIAIALNGRRALSASADQTLQLWDLASGSRIVTLKEHTGPVNAVSIAPNGFLALSASSDGTIRIWDLENGGIVTLRGHTDGVNCVAITQDGRCALSASSDRTLRLWDLSERRQILKFTTDDSMRSCAVAAKDQVFVAGGQSGRVYFLGLVSASAVAADDKISLLQ